MILHPITKTKHNIYVRKVKSQLMVVPKKTLK